MSEKQFEGKSAIVTGATRGIGKSIALELAKRGANVAFNYSKSADEADKLKAEIEGLGVKITKLTDAEKKVFQNATKGVYEKWKGRIGADLVSGAEKAVAGR